MRPKNEGSCVCFFQIDLASCKAAGNPISLLVAPQLGEPGTGLRCRCGVNAVPIYVRDQIHDFFGTVAIIRLWAFKPEVSFFFVSLAKTETKGIKRISDFSRILFVPRPR